MVEAIVALWEMRKAFGPWQAKTICGEKCQHDGLTCYFDGWKFKGDKGTKHAALFGTIDEAIASFDALIGPEEHSRTYYRQAMKDLGFDPNSTIAQVDAEYDAFFINKIWPYDRQHSRKLPPKVGLGTSRKIDGIVIHVEILIDEDFKVLSLREIFGCSKLESQFFRVHVTKAKFLNNIKVDAMCLKPPS